MHALYLSRQAAYCRPPTKHQCLHTILPSTYLKLGTGAYRQQSHRTCHFGEAFSPRANVRSATIYVLALRRRTFTTCTDTAYNKLLLCATKLAQVTPQFYTLTTPRGATTPTEPFWP